MLVHGLLFTLFLFQYMGGSIEAGECPDGEPIRHFDTYNEKNPSVHDDLTMTEIQKVYDYMAKQSEFVNMKGTSDVILASTYIYLIERHPPPKTEVLAYQAGTGPKPERFALVIMFRGDKQPAVIEEYKVGPLPSIQGYEKLSIAGRDNVEYNRRNYYGVADLPVLHSFILEQVAKVDHLLRQVTGGYTMNNCTTKCLTWLPGIPGSYTRGERSFWAYVLRHHEGLYVLPMGLEFRVVMNDHLDPKDWLVDFVHFRGESFGNMDHMAQQYTVPRDNNPLVLVDDRNLYSSLNFRGDPLPKKKQRGPKAFMPDGHRYKVDGHQVEWQGWSFNFNLRTRMGLQVHDIYFKGEKIAYELSMSEIGIIYSGATPSPKHTAYVDSTFFLGWESYELVEGVDCPDYATYFDFAHYFKFKPMLYKKPVCLYEQDSGIPLRRHYESDHDGSYAFVQGMQGNVLKLKSVMTVYNYEYMVDYTFHQNGGIEVTVSLSGYILSSYYRGQPTDDRYGFEVSPEGLGSIHNHMLHFKADLDILGTENRFETFDIKVEEVPDPADQDSTMFIQMFEKNLRESEREATWQYNMTTPKYLLMYNDQKENKFGNKRAYRIVPINVNAQLIPQGQVIENLFTWGRYQAVVTKYKETELTGSCIYNMINIPEPVVKFQDFIDDDESIVDEDLVVWISMGTFHIPHTEDIPIVTTPSLNLRYFLLPYNFLEEDPSLASRDNIRITPREGGGQNVEYAGVPPDVSCTPRQARTSGVAKPAGNVIAWLLIIIPRIVHF